MAHLGNGDYPYKPWYETVGMATLQRDPLHNGLA